MWTKKAAQYAERLCGFFPTTAATDQQIFLTGLVELLAAYPQQYVESILSPLSGLPAKHKFLPSLSEIREALEDCGAHDRRMADYSARFQPQPALQISGPVSKPPPSKYPATRSGLCAKYKIRDVPPGWTAVDVAMAAGKYGDKLPAHIDEILRQITQPPKSVFADVADGAKEAMDDRLDAAE